MYTLPNLPYSYNALEPYIDEETMKVHHDKHHATYTEKLNVAVGEIQGDVKPLEEIFATVSMYPESLRNNGGGYYNHKLFWEVMAPPGADGGGDPTDPDLVAAINHAFGSLRTFREAFESAAFNRFGSGWAWLIVTPVGLEITSTPNQDNPLMDIAEVKGKPILVLDVWEHAYYLKYQNRRAEYIANWWNVVNWGKVAERFANIH